MSSKKAMNESELADRIRQFKPIAEIIDGLAAVARDLKATGGGWVFHGFHPEKQMIEAAEKHFGPDQFPVSRKMNSLASSAPSQITTAASISKPVTRAPKCLAHWGGFFLGNSWHRAAKCAHRLRRLPWHELRQCPPAGRAHWQVGPKVTHSQSPLGTPPEPLVVQAQVAIRLGLYY
jgi:hypothetical protein